LAFGAFLRVVAGLAFYGLCLFVSAGTVDWAGGWLLLLILAYAAIGEVVVLAARNRALLAERSRPLRDPAFEPWDLWITLVAGMLFLVVLVVCGLDHRFGWTPALPGPVMAAGAAGALAGNTLFLWAMTSNGTFFRGVRIDTDHHDVARAGPYRIVRHPGYLGAIIAQLTMPIAAGTLVALLPAALGAAALIRRTQLEDRFLLESLVGYAAFAGQTRYRLVPAVW